MTEDIRTFAAIITIFTFIIYLTKSMFSLIFQHFPLKEVLINTNTINKSTLDPLFPFLDYGNQFSFRLDFITRTKDVLIQSASLLVQHGILPSQILNCVSATDSILIYADYFEVYAQNFEGEIFQNEDFLWSNFQIFEDKVYIKRIRKHKWIPIGHTFDKVLYMHQNKILEVNAKYEKDQIDFEAPLIYLKISVNGVTSMYMVYAILMNYRE